MKQLLSIFVLSLTLVACGGHSNTKETEADKIGEFISTTYNVVVLKDLKKLYVVGDFLGNGKQDTLFQHNYSKYFEEEIEVTADPYRNDWEEVVKWFDEQDPDLYLSFKKNNQDTLHLGNGQGLYCLINIGDNNADGKDEIALVVDNLDFSRTNTCYIYSLCNGKWIEHKQFGILEDAFDTPAGEITMTFNEIKNYLEYQNERWMYSDYEDKLSRNQKDHEKMSVLKIETCK